MLNAAAGIPSLHRNAKPGVRARQDTTVERSKGLVPGKSPGVPKSQRTGVKELVSSGIVATEEATHMRMRSRTHTRCW